MLTAPVAELVEELADEIVVVKDGVIAAHDTIAGLRQFTHCHGPLGEVLAQLTHPETLDNVERYFA